jgi:hypothetical protein
MINEEVCMENKKGTLLFESTNTKVLADSGRSPHIHKCLLICILICTDDMINEEAYMKNVKENITF